VAVMMNRVRKQCRKVFAMLQWVPIDWKLPHFVYGQLLSDSKASTSLPGLLLSLQRVVRSSEIDI